MSADFINPIGGRTPRLNQTGRVAPQRDVQAPPKAETPNNVAAQNPTEGFSPTAEAKETATDQKAGEAKASEILGAWSTGQPNATASSGQLVVGGASNTAVNQVHGTSNGAYSSPNANAGFSEATTYSSRPPLG